MLNHTQPDSQTEPLGVNQSAWIKKWILDKNFRDHENGPLIKTGLHNENQT